MRYGAWLIVGALAGSLLLHPVRAATNFTGPSITTPIVLTDGATVSVAAPVDKCATYTLTITGASHTLSNPTSLRAGQCLNFIITQNGTGGFTPLWDTQYSFPYATPAYNLTATTGVSVVSCVSVSTSLLQCLSGGSVPTGANPTATAGAVAINGTSGSFMRADGAPALTAATSSTAGINTTQAVPTQQHFTSGTGATYTTPAGTKLIVVHVCAGGGGGGGSGGSTHPTGTTGTTSTFNSVNAIGGTGGVGGVTTTGGTGGAGGTGGTGSATFRTAGRAGANAGNAALSVGGYGGDTRYGVVGSGGQGASSALSEAGGGGGGGGECFDLRITTPAGTYTYTVGGGGAGGIGTGTGAATGVAGLTGEVTVDEYYDH